MKKYSIYISHIADDKYSISFKSWEYDEEGKEINIRVHVDTNVTFEKAIEELNKFKTN